MTARQATTLDSAKAAIARQKLEQRLTAMRERGETAAAEREPPWCLDCGNALTPILCGYGCGRCRAVSVEVEHNGITARVRVEEGQG